MMRKIFGGAMAFSLVGAVVLGGVLAWSNSQSITGTNQVGNLAFTIGGNPGPTGALLGPDDGTDTRVYNGNITNTGSFNLKYNGGEVNILDNNAGAPGEESCGIQNFGGAVVVLAGGTAVIPPLSSAPANVGGNFGINLHVNSGAPNACMNDIVSWRATINVVTSGN